MSTSRALPMAALSVTVWFSARPRSSAVASVSPTSAAGVRAGSVVTESMPARSVLRPPAVITVITPAPTPAGTVKLTSCWSGALPSPSTMVRTVKSPTVRPSMLMTRSLRVSPVPSSKSVLPVATVPPTALSVGTTCRLKLALLPSTVTAPVRARTGTTTVSERPSPEAEPVRVRVPRRPLSSMPWNCTSVPLVKPWPVRVMVWLVKAAACPALVTTPRLFTGRLAVMAVNTATGCTPKSKLANSSQPPSVTTRIGPSRLRGATMPRRPLVAPSMSMGLSLVIRSCWAMPPTMTVVAPSMKPEPLTKKYQSSWPGRLLLMLTTLGTTCSRMPALALSVCAPFCGWLDSVSLSTVLPSTTTRK